MDQVIRTKKISIFTFSLSSHTPLGSLVLGLLEIRNRERLTKRGAETTKNSDKISMKLY